MHVSHRVFEVEGPDLYIRGRELLFPWDDTINFVLLGQLIAEGEVSALQLASQALEIVFNNEVCVSKFDSPTALVLYIGDLVVGLTLDSIKPKVLGQVKQEACVITPKVEAR